MPRNGSGTYSLPQPPFVAGTTISSAAMNSDLSDIATALTGSLPRDGQAGMSGQFKATDGGAALPSMSFVNDVTSGFFRPGANQIGVAIAGVQVATFGTGGLFGGNPVGLVSDFAGATAPSLWLFCYGQAVSRTTYALLFAAIGTLYGSGDGSTTFNLPDLRGIITIGRDDMGGTPSGRITTTYFGTDPTVMGAGGGSQNRALITANLPAYTPAGTIAVTNGLITNNVTGGIFASNGGTSGTGTGANTALNGATAITVTASQAASSAAFTGTAQGGSSTAFGIIQPGRILNKIIYAGA